jgi:hypothetical protein
VQHARPKHTSVSHSASPYNDFCRGELDGGLSTGPMSVSIKRSIDLGAGPSSIETISCITDCQQSQDAKEQRNADQNGESDSRPIPEMAVDSRQRDRPNRDESEHSDPDPRIQAHDIRPSNDRALSCRCHGDHDSAPRVGLRTTTTSAAHIRLPCIRRSTPTLS